MSHSEDIIQVAGQVPRGKWTTYGTISKLVYDDSRAAQWVGTVIRNAGLVDSSHRTLKAKGKVSPDWRVGDLGPEECIRRLCEEGTWDETRQRAHIDRFLDTTALKNLPA